MSRRHAAGILAATSLLATASPSNAVDYDETEFPRAGCTRAVTDGPGDGKYQLQSNPAVPRPSDTNVPPLDILGLALGTTETDFKVYLQVANLSTPFDQTETAYQWDVSFETTDGAVVTLATRKLNTTYNSANNLQPTSPGSYPKGSFVIGTSTGSFSQVFQEQDTAKNTIVFKIALSELQKAFPSGMTLGTSELKKISATSAAYMPHSPSVSKRADTVATETTYVVGDSYCFGPPPALLSAFSTKTVQFSDTTTLTATLKSEAGDALAGKAVEFRVAGETAVLRGTTNGSGVATVSYKPTITASKPKVTVSFAGDADHGKSTLVGEVIVAAEKTAFNALAVARPTATTRKVTATLLDDDKKAVAGQKVDVYVNGRKVTSLTTNSKGQVIYSGAKPTQSVYVKYAGLSGKYLGATSKTVKV